MRGERWWSRGLSGDRKGVLVGGAVKKVSKSLGERGTAIARPPSVIDQRVGSHSLCLYVLVYGWVWVVGREGERKRETEERFCPQGLSWACAGSYKKTGNKEQLLLWQKWLIPTLAYMINSAAIMKCKITFACLFSKVLNNWSTSSNKSRRLCKHKPPSFPFCPWPLYSLPTKLSFMFFKLWEGDWWIKPNGRCKHKLFLVQLLGEYWNWQSNGEVTKVSLINSEIPFSSILMGVERKMLFEKKFDILGNNIIHSLAETKLMSAC